MKKPEIKTPEHVAIIMDGNRRWAKEKGLSVIRGHNEGAKAFEKISDIFREKGIKVLTVYAFSSENWKRSKTEVGHLMRLMKRVLKNKVKKLHQKNIRLIVSGKIKGLSKDLQKTIHEAMELTKDNSDGVLNIAMNYGGREEILSAIKKIMKEKKCKVENLTEEAFSKYLYTGGLPDPDLMIRTSGEQRISNFLPWQLAYTELYFTDKNWPDFGSKDLDKAISEYKKRQRRLGK